MTAVKRGAPDYRHQIEVLDPENVWGIRPAIGNAELAARLGSPVTWQRTGTVIYMEYFENGLPDAGLSLGGSDGKIELTAKHKHTGGYCLHMLPDTVGYLYATYGKHLELPTSMKKTGIEFHILKELTEGRLDLNLYIFDGSQRTTYGIDWNMVTGEIRYVDSTSTAVSTGHTLVPDVGPDVWHAIKLIVDTDLKQYVKFYIDSTEGDLSGIAANVTANDTPPGIELQITAANPDAAADADMWLDDIITTIREPT